MDSDDGCRVCGCAVHLNFDMEWPDGRPICWPCLWEERSAVLEQLAESEEKFHQVMQALRDSRMGHGDCKSGKRYGGIPKACTACMAKLKLDELLAAYKGRKVRLA